MQSNQDSIEMNESLGAYLRKSREEKNVSIEQVAYATRISLKMLRALEEDDHTALPAPTFVRGYLQAYAKYVRIDSQDLLLRYQHHLATAPDAKRGAIRSHYLYVRERYQEKRRLLSAILLFAFMLSMVGALFFYKTQREKHKRLAQTADMIQRSEEQKPAPAAAESPLARDATKPEKAAPKAPEKMPDKASAPPLPPPVPPVAVAPPPPSPPPAPTPAPPPAAPAPVQKSADATPPAAAGEKKNYQLALKASEDVWFRYQTDEDEVKDLTLRSGKTMLLRADKVIKIFSGNLGAFKGTLNGKELGPLATSKGVKSAVLPESEVPNYKLPLFPQFQVKRAAKADDAPQDSNPSGDINSPSNSENQPAAPSAQ